MRCRAASRKQKAGWRHRRSFSSRDNATIRQRDKLSTGALARPATRALVVLVFCLVLTAPVHAQTSDPISAPDPQTIVGAPAGQTLEGVMLERKTKEVAGLLRCPVCQGLSVWDSPAEMAVNMKHQVGDLVAQGYSEEQILAYFEASYGEFVRLAPAPRGVNWLVWMAPIVLLILGVVVVFRTLGGSESPEMVASVSASSTTDRDLLPGDPDLDEWVLEVRRLAYGWKSGRSPVTGATE